MYSKAQLSNVVLCETSSWWRIAIWNLVLACLAVTAIALPAMGGQSLPGSAGTSDETVISIKSLSDYRLSSVPAASSAQATSLKSNFAGLDDAMRFSPADPNLAVGPRHIVQVVNSLMRVTDKNGGNSLTVDPADLLGDFYMDNPYQGLPFAPWAVYDHFASRFVIVWLTLDYAVGSKGFYILQISNTSDPTQGWKLFLMRSEIVGTVDDLLPAFYAKLGFDDTNFYLTSDYIFGVTNVRVLGKKQFYNWSITQAAPNAPIEFVDFYDPPDGKSNLSSPIQPCVTFGQPGKEYFVRASLAVPDNDGNYLTVYSMTGTWPNRQKALPVFKVEGVVLFNEWYYPDLVGEENWQSRYAVQPAADGDQTTRLVYFGDDRLINAVYRNGVIFTAHSIFPDPSAPSVAGIKAIDVAGMTKVLDEPIGFSGCLFLLPRGDRRCE